MSVSVVVPVYRSKTVLNELVERIQVVLTDVNNEIILVDDGSFDETWEIVSVLAAGNHGVVGIRLGRNSGQHSALLAGVRAAQFQTVITIDDDLQNPPEQIPTLLQALHSSGADVVYGSPIEVAQSFFRRKSSWLLRQTMRHTLGVSDVATMSSFRAFHLGLRDAFDANVGPGVSLDALLSWATDRFASVPVTHDQRVSGRSTYSVSKLLRFALDTITGYSTVPLRAVSALGFATATAGLFLMIIFVLIPAVRGISIQGFPFLASTIILFSGIQLVTLGVFGEYLSRMHFRLMNKPSYFIAQRTDGS